MSNMLEFRNKKVKVNIIVNNGILVSTNFGTSLPLEIELIGSITTLNIVTTGNSNHTIESVIVSGAINPNLPVSSATSLQIPCDLDDASEIIVTFTYVPNTFTVTVIHEGCSGNSHTANGFNGLGPYTVDRDSNISITTIIDNCCLLNSIEVNSSYTQTNNTITLPNITSDKTIIFHYTKKQIEVRVNVVNGVLASGTNASKFIDAGSSITLGTNGNAGTTIQSVNVIGMSPNPTPIPSNTYTLNTACNLINNSVITITFVYSIIQWQVYPSFNGIAPCNGVSWNWSGGSQYVNNNGSLTITAIPSNNCCKVENWQVMNGILSGNTSGSGGSAFLSGIQSDIYITFNLAPKTFILTVVHNHPSGCSGSNSSVFISNSLGGSNIQNIIGSGSPNQTYIINCNDIISKYLNITPNLGNCCNLNLDNNIGSYSVVGDHSGVYRSGNKIIIFNISSNITLTFNYAVNNNQIGVSINPSTASICSNNNCEPFPIAVAIPNGGGTINCNTSTTVGYSFLNGNFMWDGMTSDLGLSVSANNVLTSYTFTPTKSGTITFNFKRKLISVSVNISGCSTDRTITITSSNNNSNITNNSTNSKVNSITRTSGQSFSVDSGTCINISIPSNDCCTPTSITFNGSSTGITQGVNTINNLCLSVLSGYSSANINFTYATKTFTLKFEIQGPCDANTVLYYGTETSPSNSTRKLTPGQSITYNCGQHTRFRIDRTLSTNKGSIKVMSNGNLLTTLTSSNVDYVNDIGNQNNTIKIICPEYAVTMYVDPAYMGNIIGGTTGLYNHGHVFNLTATPTDNTLYKFCGWKNNISGNYLTGSGTTTGFVYNVSGNNINIILIGDMTLIAVFKLTSASC